MQLADGMVGISVLVFARAVVFVVGMLAADSATAGMLVVGTVMCYFHNYRDAMPATASAATGTVGVQFPISSSLYLNRPLKMPPRQCSGCK